MTSSIFLADLREHLVKGDAALEPKLKLDRLGLPARRPRQRRPRPIPRRSPRSTRRSPRSSRGAAGRRDALDALDHRREIALPQPASTRSSRPSASPRSTARFSLDAAGNNEVRFAFLDLAVANRFDPAVPALEQFLMMQGRRKFVRPLITSLAEDAAWGRPIAMRVYAKARPQYHPVTTRDLDKLGLAGAESEPTFNREVTLFGVNIARSNEWMSGCTKHRTVTSA